VKKKKLIFVVDDDQVANTLVKRRLESLGLDVKSFAFGEECLEQLGEDPDLIILDYHFESRGRNAMDGMAVFERIRAVMPAMPVIILSGQENGEVVFELIRKGIDGYVIKDAALIGNLITSVNDILKRSGVIP
jgi:CheY-like chemotaxis protein